MNIQQVDATPRDQPPLAGEVEVFAGVDVRERHRFRNLAQAFVILAQARVFDPEDFVAGIVAAKLYEKLPAMDRRGTWLYLPAMAGGLFLIAHPQLFTGSLADINTALHGTSPPLRALARTIMSGSAPK